MPGSIAFISSATVAFFLLEIVEVIKGIKRGALKWKIENIACGAQDCRDCVL